MIERSAIEAFTKAISQEPQSSNNKYNAVVSRIDNEQVIWVQVAGSDIETPTASTSAEVKQGDNVVVEWRNNKLYIAGNTSNPSAGVIRVDAVERAAGIANQAAQRAVADASIAREAAESVQGIAQEAQRDADSAKKSATTAINQLGYIEDVVGTLEWIAEHGEYEKTEDTEIQEGKIYFRRVASLIEYPFFHSTRTSNGITFTDNGDGTVTANGTATADTGFGFRAANNEHFRLQNIDYTFTGCPQGGTDDTYYVYLDHGTGAEYGRDYGNGVTFTGIADEDTGVWIWICAGTTIDNLTFEARLKVAGEAEYIPVTPVSNPKAEGLYELSSVDEAVSKYVAAHLALTDEGLYIQTDAEEGWRVLIKGDAIYIIDSLGERVAAFQGQNIDLGMNTISAAITMCKQQCVIDADMTSEAVERGTTWLINLNEGSVGGDIEYDFDSVSGIATINGTATADRYITVGNYPLETLKKYSTYTLTGCPAGGSLSTYYLDIQTNPDSEGNRRWYHDTGAGITFKGNGVLGYEVRVVIKKGTRVNNLEFEPILEEEAEYGIIDSSFYTQGLKESDYTKRRTAVGRTAYFRAWDISDSQGEVQDSGLEMASDTMEFSSSVRDNSLLLRRRLDIDSVGLAGIPITIHGSASEGDNAMIRAESDSGVAVRFGVGNGGNNHGIWSEYDEQWMVYSNAQGSVFINGINTDNLLQKSQIITAKFTIDNISIDASAVSGIKTVSVAKSGYTPLMIQVSLNNASSSGKNASGCNAYLQELSGTTARVNIANRFNSAAKVKAIITVLYKAN